MMDNYFRSSHKLFFRVNAADREGNRLSQVCVRATSRDRAVECVRRKVPAATGFVVKPCLPQPVFLEA